MMTSVCLMVWCWCPRRWYFVRAVHDNVSVFIAFIGSDVQAVLRDMAQLLALETLIFLI